MSQVIEAEFQVPENLANCRFDKILAEMMPQYSRSKLADWLKSGYILIDGDIKLPKTKAQGFEHITVKAPLEAETIDKPEDIVLNVLYEDPHLLVIDKPAGLVVHPGAGNKQGTLLNGLLNHASECSNLPRAGIVHRLDKDTSGLMVVAKSLEAHHGLVKMLQARAIERHYYAICQGTPISGGTIETFMGRHPHQRIKMAVTKSGKEAVTHYRIHSKFEVHTWLDIKLDTGRTHQIRVHMAHRSMPIVGDPLYGGRMKFPKGCTEVLQLFLSQFKRQALHAYRLSFLHPVTDEKIDIQSSLPEDFKKLVEVLKNHGINQTMA